MPVLSFMCFEVIAHAAGSQPTYWSMLEKQYNDRTPEICQESQEDLDG